MSKKTRTPRSRSNLKQQNKAATAWFAAAAILIAAGLSYLVVQAQNQLETVQGELRTVREAAFQAKAKTVELEQISTTWQRTLAQADLKRNELAGQLKTANSEIERLSQIVDAAASQADWQSRLETMQDELANAKQSLGTRLRSAQTDVEQLRSELNATKSELARVQLRLQSKNLEDASGQSEPGAPRSANQADPQTDKKKSPRDISKSTKQVRVPHGDRDYLIRTVVFEASGETEIGKAAVAHVILNRQSMGRWGARIKDVVTHPWQFEPWMTRKGEIEKLSSKDPRYLAAAKIADAVLGGDMPDPTAGATHFLNPVIVRQRRGGSLPSWADGDGQPIGRHVFYFPERDRPEPQRADVREFQPTNSLRHSAAFPGAG
jgi:spore germination cell wall hydrolase CwlJ-like protein